MKLEHRGDNSPLFLFMKMEEEKKIKALVEEIIKDQEELFLVDLKLKGNTGNQKVLIFVDGDQGISIDQCSQVSRRVGASMEEEDFMQGKYTLEVSSPGLDFPLTLPRQYAKNIGRELEIETTENEKIVGELVEIVGNEISLKESEKIRSLQFEKIKQSKVKVSFK